MSPRNNSKFTVKEIAEIIPKMIFNENCIVESFDYYNSTLCEFSKEEKIIIENIDDDGDILDILFHQIFEGSEDTEIFKYRILIPKTCITK